MPEAYHKPVGKEGRAHPASRHDIAAERLHGRTATEAACSDTFHPASRQVVLAARRFVVLCFCYRVKTIVRSKRCGPDSEAQEVPHRCSTECRGRNGRTPAPAPAAPPPAPRDRVPSDAQGPLLPIGLRDVPAPHRRGPIPARAQHGFELVQHPLDSVLLDRHQRLTIDARGAAVPLHSLPGFAQDVTLHTRSYSAWKRRSGCRLATDHSRRWSSRTLSTGLRRSGSWVRSCRPCPRAFLRLRHPHPRDPSLRRRCSSPPSPVLRSPRTPAAHDATSPSAYTRRFARTRATQTGLSCSPSSLEHVLRPIPGRTRGRCSSGLPFRERGLRRDMRGSAPALFICRGGRLHLMLRPALLLPP